MKAEDQNNGEVLEKSTISKKVIQEIPKGFGVRYTLSILGLLALAINYCVRVNISIAIIAMVNQTDVSSDDNISNACPIPENRNQTSTSYTTGTFDWDEHVQGLVLGAFFYGYLVTNIFGGLAAEYWGGKVVTGFGIIVSSIFTILNPIAANSSTWVLIAVRVLMGAASGVLFPALTSLIASWYPTSERSKHTAIMFAGDQIGTVFALPLTGILCDSDFLGGWPSSFYVFGFIGLVWGVFWFWLVVDDPRDHPSISEKELIFITDGCPAATKNLKRVPVPWKEILTSVRFWAIAAGNFSNNWIFYTMLTQLPTYLDQIQHFNIKSNGFLSALPYLGSWLFSMVFSFFINKMLTMRYISLHTVRRISMGTGNFGPVIGFLGICLVNCNSTAAIFIFVIGYTMNGAIYSGYMCSHVDISPRFAGTLMGLTNTVGTIPGFISPSVTGAITYNNQTLWAWRTVFLLASAIAICFNSFYIIFVTTETQSWNEPQVKKKKGDESQ